MRMREGIVLEEILKPQDYTRFAQEFGVTTDGIANRLLKLLL